MHRISRRRYTDDFKAQAVALAESASRSKAARQLDIPIKTLGNWLGASRAGRGRRPLQNRASFRQPYGPPKVC